MFIKICRQVTYRAHFISAKLNIDTLSTLNCKWKINLVSQEQKMIIYNNYYDGEFDKSSLTSAYRYEYNQRF